MQYCAADGVGEVFLVSHLGKSEEILDFLWNHIVLLPIFFYLAAYINLSYEN